jgi:signal transduction histidine kinase
VVLWVLVILLLGASFAFVAYRVATPIVGRDLGAGGNRFGAVGIAIAPGVAHPDAATVIAAGDVVTSFLGRSTEAWAAALIDPAADRPSIVEGQPAELTIDRGGTTVSMSIMAARSDPIRTMTSEWGVVGLAFTMMLVGLYLFARRPDEPAARALLVAGTAMFASTLPWAAGLQVSDLATGSGFWLYAFGAGVAYTLFWAAILHFVLVFPRPYPWVVDAGGRVSTTRVAAIYVAVVGSQVALIVGAVLSTGRALPGLEAWISGQIVLQVVVVVSTLVLMAYSYARRLDAAGRLQLRWIAAAVGLVAIGSLALWFGPELVIGGPLIPRSAVALLGLPFPIALAVAIDRHHLFDLPTLVNRSLVYGSLTAGVLATYAVAVVVLSTIVPGDAPFAVSLLAAGTVAIVAIPLRDRLQQRVDRSMYGDRNEPDRALRRLGARLASSVDPQTVNSTIVTTIAEALKAPYVAIETGHPDRPITEAAFGQIPVDVGGPRPLVRIPVVSRGREVARFSLAPRDAREPFDARDLRLLDDLAGQAAPMLEAVRLTADLRRSQRALVSAREEERRRLRRDLHDELGPTLAGQQMKIGAATALIDSDPDRARALLAEMEGASRATIEEVRRLARDLRPPALDELGLVGALEQHAAMFGDVPTERPMHITIVAPRPLPALPAAVEVAALRIAQEALVNAARHGAASQVTVRLVSDDDTLVLSVTDDGAGLAAGAHHGVGLTSMYERAEELGGSIVVGRIADQGGTRVAVSLPIAAEAPT